MNIGTTTLSSSLVNLSLPNVQIRLDNKSGISRPLAFLDDLGRATRRGIRKCPSCGTLNGTRGLSCKNPACNHVFRDKSDSPKSAISRKVKLVGKGNVTKVGPKAFKICNGAPVHLFSVRYYSVPATRTTTTPLVESYGFVQLPVVQDSEGNTTETVDPAVYAFVGQCHLADCTQRNARHLPMSSSSATVTLPTGNPECCPHVSAAIRAMNASRGTSMTDVLHVSASIIEALPIPEVPRALLALWASEEHADLEDDVQLYRLPEVPRSLLALWASEVYAGLEDDVQVPVVQRLVGTCTMVVRCIMDAVHEFGFVHLSILPAGRGDGKSKKDSKPSPQEFYVCRCEEFQQTADQSQADHCVHFYACLCAFVADEQLATEFKPFIQLVTKTAEREIELKFSDVDMTGFSDDHGNSDVEGCDQLVTLHDGEMDESADVMNINESGKISDSGRAVVRSLRPIARKDVLSFNPYVEGGGVVDRTEEMFIEWLSGVTERINETMLYQDHEHFAFNQQAQMQKCSEIKQIQKFSNNLTECVYTFVGAERVNLDRTEEILIDWLSGVTERINETMLYQDHGNPAPLVYHISEKMFECFEWRMADVGGAKGDITCKRAADWTLPYSRTEAPPYGTYNMSRWDLSDMELVQRIFDTPMVTLDIMRNFSTQPDGSYELISTERTLSSDLLGSDDTLGSDPSSSQRPIRPAALRTFLKIGKLKGSSEATPLSIEWIPDLFPITRLGELRIRFEYGHEHNGKIMHNNVQSTVSSINIFSSLP